MGLQIEMCGRMLFVTGPTGLYAKDLQELGFTFIPSLGRWCYRPIGFESPNLEGMTMDSIRETFGTDKHIVKSTPAAITNPQGRGDNQ